MLDLADKHVRKLLEGKGPNSRPRWSPDGRQIAYETANGEPYFFYAERRIAARSRRGRRTPRMLDGQIR